MANLKKALGFNIRTGRAVNIIDVLDEIEDKLRCNIKGDIEAFTTLDEVSAETYNDEVDARVAIGMLEKLGYIDEEESQAMMKKAAEIRIAALEELEKEIEDKLRCNIKGDIEAFTTLDEVSAETYNDEVDARVAIGMLEKLGYIDEEESQAMMKRAAEIRIAELEELEKEIENRKE